MASFIIRISWIVVVCTTSSVSALDSTETDPGEHGTALCYAQMYKFLLSTTEDPLTSEGKLNTNVSCPAMQLMGDCMAGLRAPSGFALDVNRFMNWQICLLDSKLLCPGGLKCDALGKVTKDSDIVKSYMSEVAADAEGEGLEAREERISHSSRYPAIMGIGKLFGGDDQFEDCSREWQYRCNELYVGAVKRLNTIDEYYQCYVDAQKACPSTYLQHLGKLCEGFLSPGSALHDMEKKLGARIMKIMRQAAEANRQEL